MHTPRKGILYASDGNTLVVYGYFVSVSAAMTDDHKTACAAIVWNCRAQVAPGSTI
eukprot:XP_001704903.1 Hypothetical protein GL50803_37265 [Giardia lamblia ATCC 50803]